MNTLPHLMLQFGKSVDSHGHKLAVGLERTVSSWNERAQQLADAAEKLEKRVAKPAFVA